MVTYKGIEQINCPLCNQDNAVLLFTAPVQPHQAGYFTFDEWNIVQCKNCELIYVNPRISKSVNDQYYKFELENDHEFLNAHFIETANTQTPYWQRMVRIITKYQHPGRLLDIGSGSGSLLVQARSAGYDVYGQDIAPFFIDFCKNNYDLSIYEGELESLNIPDGCFDIITCFDVIEHHRQPLALLREIRRILKPNGVLAISTHDMGNFWAKIYGKNWRMIYPIGHLTYFTRKTLKKILLEAGFQVIKAGGANTIDTSLFSEFINTAKSWFTTIFLRALIIWIYKPLSNIFPFLQNWVIKYKGGRLTHKLLLFKAGTQIISNDEMVMIARPIATKEERDSLNPKRT